MKTWMRVLAALVVLMLLVPPVAALAQDPPTVALSAVETQTGVNRVVGPARASPAAVWKDGLGRESVAVWVFNHEFEAGFGTPGGGISLIVGDYFNTVKDLSFKFGNDPWRSADLSYVAPDEWYEFAPWMYGALWSDLPDDGYGVKVATVTWRSVTDGKMHRLSVVVPIYRRAETIEANLAETNFQTTDPGVKFVGISEDWGTSYIEFLLPQEQNCADHRLLVNGKPWIWPYFSRAPIDVWGNEPQTCFNMIGRAWATPVQNGNISLAIDPRAEIVSAVYVTGGHIDMVTYRWFSDRWAGGIVNY